MPVPLLFIPRSSGGSSHFSGARRSIGQLASPRKEARVARLAAIRTDPQRPQNGAFIPIGPVRTVQPLGSAARAGKHIPLIRGFGAVLFGGPSRSCFCHTQLLQRRASNPRPVKIELCHKTKFSMIYALHNAPGPFQALLCPNETANDALLALCLRLEVTHSKSSHLMASSHVNMTLSGVPSLLANRQLREREPR